MVRKISGKVMKGFPLDKVFTMVRRYPFEDKVALCSYWSRKLCKDWMFDINALSGQGLKHPFSIAHLAMIAVATEEWGRQSLKEREFFRMLSLVWSAVPFDDSADLWMILGQYIYIPQYSLRKDPRIYLSRFYYIFTHKSVGLDNRFEELFNVPYIDAIAVANAIYALEFNGKDCLAVFNAFKADKNFRLDVQRFEKALRVFVITRSDFISQQRELWGKSGNALLSENLLFKHPLIEYDGRIHFPVPYVMRYAATYGLFHCVAPKEDTKLRSDVGKKVLEEYVVELLRMSGAYKHVSPERTYFNDKSSLSPDAICISDNKCLLVEVKLREPDDKMRSLRRKDSGSWTSAVYDALSQLRKKFIDRGQYLDRDFDEEDVYGAVVVFEESGVGIGEVFDRYERLHPDVDMDYVRRHFKIMELYDLELICARKQSLIDVMVKTSVNIEDCKLSRLYEQLPNAPYEVPYFDRELENSINAFVDMFDEKSRTSH